MGQKWPEFQVTSRFQREGRGLAFCLFINNFPAVHSNATIIVYCYRHLEALEKYVAFETPERPSS
jgi:hypothetical protein